MKKPGEAVTSPARTTCQEVDIDNIPHGYCHCGCSRKTHLAPRTDYKKGWIRGNPLKYLKGHKAPPANKGPRISKPEYKKEDCGFRTPCWVWQLGLNGQGYGARWNRRAHVLYYERRYGPVPAGLELDHLCGIRSCVNPAHLEPVTHAENLRRGMGAKLSHEKADRIRALYERGNFSQRQLAQMYNVAHGTIGRIVRRESWVT